MSVTEVKQAIGRWELVLHEETPVDVTSKLTYFGHIVLLPSAFDPAQYNDNLLNVARYVGVFRGRDAHNTLKLKGSGMAFWLGDEDGKGDVFENAVVLDGATYANTIRALLPPGGAITEGTIYSAPGLYTGRHQWQTPREALTYVTDLFNTEWRVNHNGTLDAGPIADLYVTAPKTLIIPKGFGTDLFRETIPGDLAMGIDVEDITTRVVLLAEGEGTNIITAAANAPSTGYKDLHGNPLKATRLVSESGTEAGNAAARAQLQLNRFLNARRSVDLSTSKYDVKGSFVVGDYIDVYDPVNGFYDANREIYWQGERINPMALRCVEMTWPIPAGWTVAFRDVNGNWLDLSPYYVPETGDTTIVVGDLARGLASVGGEPVGVRPNLPDPSDPPPDDTIPAAPDFTGFSTGSYESDNRTLAAIYMTWNTPLNQDGSTITDGDHYEIRYRPNQIIGTLTTWDTLSGYTNVVSDTFEREVSNGWGPDWTNTGGIGPSEFNVTNGRGTHTHSVVADMHRSTIECGATNFDHYAEFSIPVTPSGAGVTLWLAGRVVDDNTQYVALIAVTTTGAAFLTIGKRVGGTWTELIASPTSFGTITPGQIIAVRFQGIGSALKAYAWVLNSQEEPSLWQLTTTDTSIVSGTKLSVQTRREAGNINANLVFSISSVRGTNLANGNAYSWDDLGTWDALTSTPIQASPNWTTAYVAWDQHAFTIVELSPGVQYEIQIRAVDTSNNISPWSTSEFVNTLGDAIAPSTPAPPEVSASMIAVQLIHRLGKAEGGTFNLELDLDHFDVHASDSPNFFPSSETKVGELLATGAMVRGGIPAVGTFKVNQPDEVWIRVVAVDRSGNKSGASDAVQSSVVLIDDAHISNLSVSKVTAGTITSTWIMGGKITTGQTGPRVEMTSDGIIAYNDDGVETIAIRSATGNAKFTGRLQTQIDQNGITLFHTPGNAVAIWSINSLVDDLPRDHVAYHWAHEYTNGTWGQAFEIGIRERESLVQDGGKVLLSESVAIVSHQPNGDNEAYISLGAWPNATSTGRVYVQGKFNRATAYNGQTGVWVSLTPINAGFGSLVVGYGPTMEEVMVPIVSITGTRGDACVLTASSSTGFTVGWNGTDAHVVHMWAVRMASTS